PFLESADEARDAAAVRERRAAGGCAVPVPAGQPGVGAGDLARARSSAAGPDAGQDAPAPPLARAPSRTVEQGARTARIPARATAVVRRRQPGSRTEPRRRLPPHACRGRLGRADRAGGGRARVSRGRGGRGSFVLIRPGVGGSGFRRSCTGPRCRCPTGGRTRRWNTAIRPTTPAFSAIIAEWRPLKSPRA